MLQISFRASDAVRFCFIKRGLYPSEDHDTGSQLHESDLSEDDDDEELGADFRAVEKITYYNTHEDEFDEDSFPDDPFKHNEVAPTFAVRKPHSAFYESTYL